MKRYDLCDPTCTADCGHCKGKGRPSDELRTAAATLRSRASIATPSPWVAADHFHSDKGRTYVVSPNADNYVCVGGAVGMDDDHEYIATMHPGVGLALADWLDVVAERHKSDGTEELTLHLDTECSVCDDDGHEVVVCAGCYPTWDGVDGRSIYPCAEVKAALPVARLINGGAS